MADFKLRAPPRLRFHGLASFDGVFGTGGAVALAGDAVARAVGQAALLRGINLAGAGVASSQATAALLKGIRLGGAAVGSAVGVASMNWVLGDVTVLEGGTGQTWGQFNVATRLPADYTTSGVFSVDAGGTSLPTGMTFTEAGLLDVGTAAVSTTSGVRFTYHEPGALPTLTLHPSLGGTNTLPYLATWYPNEGVVPSGYGAVSPDDSTLRGAVVSTWPDGSAQVVVLAGRTSLSNGVTKNIRLRVGQPGGTNLTVAAIDSIVTSIVVNFGAGDQTLSDLSSSSGNYRRTWWASPETICARYVLGCGVGAMQAVIDVHAFADNRAFVEVVIENGRIDCTQSAPSAPAAQTYTNATVTVNGSAINGAGTSSTWAGGSTHQAFRSWYCSGWVGGDPLVEVTHDTAYLQSHPLFFEPTAATPYNFASYAPIGSSFFGTSQVYGSDVYTPWTFGRNNWNGMGAPGDNRSIAYLPQWEGCYIQSGSRYVAKAVIASGLALMSFPINYRDSNTEDVPTHATLAGKTWAGSFPRTGSTPFANYNNYEWDYAHSPEVGLLPFLCRPSPCFIDLAQKAAVFAALGESSQRFGYFYETRGRAWCFRNLGFSVFLTPDAQSTWKASAKANLYTNVQYFRTWESDPQQKLNVMWRFQPGDYGDEDTDAGNQSSLWMSHWVAAVCHRIASVKPLAGAQQSELNAFADWIAALPVRYINESVGGEWRYTGYKIRIGNTGAASTIDEVASIGSESTWGLQRAQGKVEGPPGVSGALYTCGSEPTGYSSGWTINNGNHENGLPEVNYAACFFCGLSAAVERGVSGADTAWQTFANNVSNLSTFLANGGKDPRFHYWPRNK